MNKKNHLRKVLVVTGTRAEYGLLYYLMKELQQSHFLELQIIATCMHLSSEFGETFKLIEADGFQINEKLEMLLSSDTAVGTVKSMGVCMLGCADALSRLSPDIVVLLGDRFETLAVAQSALLLNIPIAHIHGGELSEGAVDDAIRHAITKMSHLHFVAAETYKQRVIQMGESPDRVFNTGAPGLERIERFQLLNKSQLSSALDFQFDERNLLVTYHPATIANEENMQAIEAIFFVLNEFPAIKVIFTKANADAAGRQINKLIDKFVADNIHRAKAYQTLGDLNYLSTLQFVDAVVGNSSSGLIEVPQFHIPTINIGSRQARRLRSKSVIDVKPDKEALLAALRLALSKAFKKELSTVCSPYAKFKTAEKITAIIAETNLTKLKLKSFFDLPVRRLEVHE